MKKISLFLFLLASMSTILSAQNMEQIEAPIIQAVPMLQDYPYEEMEDCIDMYRFCYYEVYFESAYYDGVTIFYRITNNEYYSTDWTVYDGTPIMCASEGHYLVEAYAYVEGQQPSEITTTEFNAYSELLYRVIKVDEVYYRITGDTEVYVSKKYPEISVDYSEGETFYSGAVVIPSQIEFWDVTYNVTGVDVATFRNCDVTSVELPNTIDQICYDAFANSHLQQIFIPASVTNLDQSAFTGCSELASIEVDANNAYYDSRNDCNAIILSYNNSLIIGCKNTIIPNTVTKIDVAAFSYCSGLTSMVIPNSVTSIESSAFAYCTGLTNIELPNSLLKIDDSAFYECTSLTGIEIPNSVTRIGRSAFYNCKGLTSVEVPNSVTTIDGWAFYGCQSLVSAKLPNTITTIGSDLFCACYSLASIEIPSSVTSIGQSAFYACRSLTSVRIPSSVTNVGYVAFGGCENLTGLTMESVTPPAASSQFYSDNYRYDQVKLFVPNESLEAYRAHREWGKFTHIVPFVGAGPGDINGDGSVAISDVSSVIDMLLEGDDLPAYCDVNGDGMVSIADVSALIDILLGF